MITQPNDITANTADTRALAALILELNIARRNANAYPKGHPVIAAALNKVLLVYKDLLNNREELILGVTSEALMVEGVLLDKTNVVYRDFARVLFERGIGALQFHPGLTIAELTNFVTILGLKREQILQHGGIEQVWLKAGITAISARPVRYDLFQTSDDDSAACHGADAADENLWVRFARELTRGELSGGDGGDTGLDPEILAEALNIQYSLGGISDNQLNEAATVFFAPIDTPGSSENSTRKHYKKLAAFISNLTPDLRRQFLNSSFGSRYHGSQDAAEQVLSGLSEHAVIDTLDDISHNRLNVSPVIFGLLERLVHNSGTPQKLQEESTEDDETAARMKTILREHASEEFVPDDYQRKLNTIIASDQIPRLNMEEVSDLLSTVENRSIESSIGQILMNLIREGVETPEERELLLQNLSDMFGFFLQTGDYLQLHRMIDQMTDGTFPVDIQYRLRDEYGRREFLEEILDGLSVWGKPRYGDIRTLIHKIGGQFIEAILDRLSEEKNMSLRRFYMDCLIEMGAVTRVPIANRLYDKRWYFLRNLLIILAAQNDPAVVDHIRPLLRNPDPRLRHEVLKTLIHFHDSQAEKQLLEDLDSQNPELQTAAVQLAEQCTSPAIALKLIAMLSQGGYSQSECDRKSAIIHSLGEIGRAEVLPELAKLLSTRSLLHSRQLTKLKSEIIQSLVKYPPAVSRPVLERIAGGSGDIARLAGDALRIISGRPS